MIPLFITQTTEIQKQTMHVQTRPGPYKTEENHMDACHFVTSFEWAEPFAFTSSKGKRGTGEEKDSGYMPGSCTLPSCAACWGPSWLHKQPTNYRYARSNSMQVHGHQQSHLYKFNNTEQDYMLLLRFLHWNVTSSHRRSWLVFNQHLNKQQENLIP